MTNHKKIIEVVAAVIENSQDQILFSSRPVGKSHAGYWEFAGGKIEEGETQFQALSRELYEELGIFIHHARPWLHHIWTGDYATIILYFWRVSATDWSGEVHAREGQGWSWQNPRCPTVFPFLPANRMILRALRIPQYLSGSLDSRLYHNGGLGEFEAISYHLAQDFHHYIWLDFNTWINQSRPSFDSVWVILDDVKQWHSVQDADAVIWKINDSASVNALLDILQQGVQIPIILQGAKPEQYVEWLDRGVHSIITPE